VKGAPVPNSCALHWLGERGYDPVYGARPLKRVVQKQLVDRLATGMLDGSIREGDTVAVSARDGVIVFEQAAAAAAAAA